MRAHTDEYVNSDEGWEEENRDNVTGKIVASGRNKQTPLATKILLEDTDGLRRPP